MDHQSPRIPLGVWGTEEKLNCERGWGYPGPSHANPIQEEEKIFPGGVMGSMESSRADINVAGS